MPSVSADLRYDPSEDDSQPARSPSALLRTLLGAIHSATSSQTAVDLYEMVSRTLTDEGVALAVLERRADQARYALITNRLGIDDAQTPLTLPELDDARALAFFPAGSHPLRRAVDDPELLTFPSITAMISAADGGPAIVLSLMAHDLGPEHLVVVQAFAELLGSAVARLNAERHLRELQAGGSPHDRVRSEDAAVAGRLAAALAAVLNVTESLRRTAAAAAELRPQGIAAVIACIDQRHLLAIAAGGALTPRLSHGVADELRSRFLTAAPDGHAGCTESPVEIVEPPPPLDLLAIDGALGAVIDVPVGAGDHTAGRIVLIDLEGADDSPSRLKLLENMATLLGPTLGRLTAARAVEGQRLGALIDSLPGGLLLLNQSGEAVAGNQPGRHLLAALHTGEDHGGLPRALQQLVFRAHCGEPHPSAELLLDTEPPRHIVGRVSPIGVAGDRHVMALSLEEVTDEVQLRERLFQSEKLSSLGRLVSSVAHELNSPLTSIMGFAQLLSASAAEGDIRHHAELIHSEADRARRIVDNLLSFARRRRPSRAPVSLNVLIEKTLELQQFDLSAVGIDVVCELAPDLPPCLADAQQIQQVLLNILTNARQAITAAARPGRITITTCRVEDVAQLTIADNGPGIPAEHLRRVFDPFFTTKAEGMGTGLGLSISSRIIEEHQGHLTVASPPGEGATFTIQLPALLPESDLFHPAARATDGVGERTILVIDDEAPVRNLLEGVLQLHGYQVVAVGSVADALEQLDHQRFDAVITDVRMPNEDGVDFYRKLRARDPLLARHIIFTSGEGLGQATRVLIQSTGVPLLPKPFKLDAVLSLVATVLARE